VLSGKIIHHHQNAPRCRAAFGRVKPKSARCEFSHLFSPVSSCLHSPTPPSATGSFTHRCNQTPGQPFRIGVLLKIEPGWHIYWKNPGDSGLATTVKLQLPPGFTAGAVQYPFPIRILLPGDIVNYAYENETMLLIPVTPPADLPPGTPVSISAKMNWLVCRESCSPGSANVSLQLPVSTAASSTNAELFDQWAARIPVNHDPEHVADISTATNLKQTPTGLAGSAEIVIQWKTVPTDIQWFPNPWPGIMVSEIKISTAKNTTAISYHVDVSSEAGNNRGIESVVVYTIPGSPRIALAIPGRGN
jgi:DsbC/DsbD-like thiol-disulfide interchange protein